MKTKFKYKGYTFKPLAQKVDNLSFAEISKRIKSDRDLGFSRYKWGQVEYNYNDFYKASGDSKADLFLCIENGNTYLPGERELFLFN